MYNSIVYCVENDFMNNSLRLEINLSPPPQHMELIGRDAKQGIPDKDPKDYYSHWMTNYLSALPTFAYGELQSGNVKPAHEDGAETAAWQVEMTPNSFRTIIKPTLWKRHYGLPM